MTPPIDETDAKQWPHAPVHRLTADGVYMVTAATLHKEHLFKASERLTLLENSLLSLSHKYEWQLEAWAVFSNHYHFVARGRQASTDLGKFLKHLHADTAPHIEPARRRSGA
jgi:putative transposase